MRALALALLLLLAGCAAPARPLGDAPAPPPPPGLTASVHLRAFGSVDALAAYLRPGTGPLISAHRGGPGPGLPENSLAAFEHSLNHAPALLECDLRVTADGHLVLMHDETVDRTTTGEGPVAALTLAELRRLRLLDPLGRPTPHRVPTLAEALAWADGRAVLVLDPKREVAPARLVEAIRQADAAARVVVITYTREQLAAYLALDRDLVFSVSAQTPDDVDALLGMHDPDRLVGWAGVGRPDPAVVARFQQAGVMVQMGTFGAIDAQAVAEGPGAYAPYLAEGIDVLATDVVPVAAQALRRPAPLPPR